MPADPVRRTAALIAALVAVPVTVAVALLSLWALGVFTTATPQPTVTARPSATTSATSTVTMAAPPLGAEAAEVCRQLVARLPEKVGDAHRRPVSGADQNAAYGEPPITLACGTSPATFPPTALLTVLNGVCWYAEQTPQASVWTTVDRRVPVQLTVPGSGDGSGQTVIAFSRAITEAVPRTDAPPTGCTG